MHLPPDSPLPLPPKDLRSERALPDVQTLRSTALARRPDPQALADRIRADEAMLALAQKEFYPDFEPFFMYDRFMGNVSSNRFPCATATTRPPPTISGAAPPWSARPADRSLHDSARNGASSISLTSRV